MSFFSKVLGRNSTYVLGIVITAFVIDRTVEVGADAVWRTANRGVSNSHTTFILVNIFT